MLFSFWHSSFADLFSPLHAFGIPGGGYNFVDEKRDQQFCKIISQYLTNVDACAFLFGVSFWGCVLLASTLRISQTSKDHLSKLYLG